MNQENKKKSIGIQTQTIHVGVSINDIRTVVNGVFYENFIKLKDEAKNIVDARILEFSEKLYAELENKDIKCFSNPDFQYSLYKASENYARTNSKQKHEILVKLIVNKALSETETAYSLMLNQAIELIPKFSTLHLNILSFVSAFKSVGFSILKRISLPNDVEEFKEFLNTILVLITSNGDFYLNDIKFISNYGLGNFLLGDKLDIQIVKNYPKLFNVVKNDNFGGKDVLIDNNGNIICMRDYIQSIDTRFTQIFETYDDSGLYCFCPSPIAEFLGLLNLTIVTGEIINLQKFF